MAQQYQPAYHQQTMRRKNGVAVAALVIGIIGVVFAIIPVLGFLSFVLGPLAVILGIVGITRAGLPRRMAAVGGGLGLLAIVIAAAVTSIFFSAFSSASDDTDAAPLPAKSEPTPAGADVLVVEAGDLLEDFDGNEAAADRKYAGRTLEVTGVAHKVNTELMDDTKYVVQLNDGSDFSFASVRCNDVPTDQAVAVVPDSTVTIRGVFDDGGDLGIDIKDCVVL